MLEIRLDSCEKKKKREKYQPLAELEGTEDEKALRTRLLGFHTKNSGLSRQ